MPHDAIQEKEVPSVSCVVLNWNGWRDTLDCLASLQGQTYTNLQVIVIDNGSTDDSVARIREAFPEIELIETGVNLGFSKGNNIGLRIVLERDPDYVWLLNNDTVCPPDTLAKLVAKGEATAGAGVVGTVLYFAHAPEQVQAWGGGHVSPWFAYSTHYFAPHVFVENDYLTFASVLIKREVLREVGLMYEGSFMYYEDNDYCQRVQRTKWKMVVAEDTRVLHKEGGSSAKGENPFRIKTVTVAGLRFLRRFSPMPWFSIPAFILLRSARRIEKREWMGLRAVYRGLLEFLREPMPR